MPLRSGDPFREPRTHDMEMHYFESEAIEAIGYAGSTLRVVFRSGRIYDHPGVPRSLFEALLEAESKGAYYVANIRGRFR